MSEFEVKSSRKSFDLGAMQSAGEPLKEGWGVLEHLEGLAGERTDIRGVLATQDQAQGVADGLNISEGMTVLEFPDDPESAIYERIYFDTGHLTLKGSEVHLVRIDTYVLADDQPAGN